MVRITTFLCVSAIILVSYAQDDASKKPAPGLSRLPKPGVSRRDLDPNVFDKRCSGTCAECFGSGYISCPGSDYYCYLPGDSTYGLDSCTGGSSSGTTTAAAPAPTSTGSAGNSDFCSGAGATCVSCFGAGYLDCGDGISCYNPADPNYDTCPDGSTPTGSTATGAAPAASTSTGSTSTCADQYGSGSVLCGTASCYNPSEGDVCCADGYHCEGGNTCSSTVGKCCAPGSTSSGCTGSSGGAGGLTTSSYTYSYSYSSLTYSSYTYSSYSYSSYSYSTPTTSDGTTFATASGSSASSTSTGVTQFDSGSGAAPRDFATMKVAGGVLGLLGLGMLLL